MFEGIATSVNELHPSNACDLILVTPSRKTTDSKDVQHEKDLYPIFPGITIELR